MPVNATPIYHIRVEGHLDPGWSDWLGGLEIAAQTDNETLLTGPVVDRAALHGILDKLYALNLTILAAVQVKIDQASDDGSRA
jgi:hypothetical protein